MDQNEIGEILRRGFVALDIPRDEVEATIQSIRDATTREKARARYDRFKARVKTRYREKALRCHPDHGGSENAFNEFGQLLKALDSLDVAPRRVPSRPVARPGMRIVSVVVIQHGSGGSSTTTTTSNPYEPGSPFGPGFG